MQAFLIVLVAVIILGGGWFWYSSQTVDTNVNVENTDPFGTNTPPPSNTNTDTPSNTGGTNIGVGGSVNVSTGTTKEFTVTNAGMTFTTKALTVKKGDTVKITFKNTGGTHDFRIDSYNVGTKVIQAGAQETFTFVADTAGSFEYFCSVGQHRANGMVGTLTVTN